MVQERDKLTVAAEGATRLRIKTQEILGKEEQLRALLASNRTKVDHLLGAPGKGRCAACASIRCRHVAGVDNARGC